MFRCAIDVIFGNLSMVHLLYELTFMAGTSGAHRRKTETENWSRTGAGDKTSNN